MISIFTSILTFYARCYRWRFKPRIIGVTGNAGKTTTKDAVAAVLATKYRVRASAGNLNNELGMPLTIVGDFADEYYRTGGGAWFWLTVLWRAKIGFWFTSKRRYPEVLVLEYGADRPGDIKRLASTFPPEIAVVTAVGDAPVHVEFFASPQHVAEEKSALVKALPPTGRAVLNGDDLTVLDMRNATEAPITTFGAGEGADVQYGDLIVRMAGQRPLGVQFNVTARGATMPVRISGTIGRGVAAASAAAIAVGQAMGIGLADAVEALTRMRMPPGRLRILDGIKGTTVIDDTYNASPAAMHLAMDAVRHLPGRHVLVLGDMLELGNMEVQAHQEVGNVAATVADVLVGIGTRGKLITDAAANQLAPERVFWFPDSTTAAPEVQKLLKPGDIVLVKGSQGVRMERIVKEIMAEPQYARELLVRQTSRWLAK